MPTAICETSVGGKANVIRPLFSISMIEDDLKRKKAKDIEKAKEKERK